MSWSECAAIGAFLKAQQEARTQRQQYFLRPAIPFQARLEGAAQRITNLTQIIASTMRPIIAKPVNFILNTFAKILTQLSTINLPARPPQLSTKFADISDKLTAMFGEFKAAAKEKASKFFEDFKKKAKGLFLIFVPFEEDEEYPLSLRDIPPLVRGAKDSQVERGFKE
jgi:hypothetical protein